MTQLIRLDRDTHWRNLARYFCRRWNRGARPDDRLYKFKIFFNLEYTPPPGQPDRIELELAWPHRCYRKAEDFK